MSVGMPKFLLLDEFGSLVRDVFGVGPYHVGSSLTNKSGWRDVDIRVMLDDDVYKEQGYGDPRSPHNNAKWRAMVIAFSSLGEKMTGLPIDFQIQQRTLANECFRAYKRSFLGNTPLRMSGYDETSK